MDKIVQHTSEKFYKKDNDWNDEAFEEIKLDGTQQHLYNDVNTTHEDSFDETEMTKLLEENIPMEFDNLNVKDIPQLFSCIEQEVNNTLPYTFIFEYIQQHYDIEYETVFHNLYSFQQNRILKEYGIDKRSNTLF